MNDQSSLPLELTLQQLESHPWEAANILSGSPVDRTNWKSYILPLLCFKRICDEEYAEAVETYGEREVKKAFHKTLFKYKLHADTELFEKAYGYIKQYD